MKLPSELPNNTSAEPPGPAITFTPPLIVAIPLSAANEARANPPPASVTLTKPFTVKLLLASALNLAALVPDTEIFPLVVMLLPYKSTLPEVPSADIPPVVIDPLASNITVA